MKCIGFGSGRRCEMIKHQQEEIQRLRAALEKARQYVVNGFELGYIDDREGYTEALVREIDEALSTTNDKKAPLWWMLECPKSGEPCYCKEECMYLRQKSLREQILLSEQRARDIFKEIGVTVE